MRPGSLPRRVLALVGALAASLLLGGTVAADASFVPGVSPETPTASSIDGFLVPALVLAVAVLGFFLIRRSSSSEVAAGILLGVLGFLVGGVLVLAGLFGDLSGRHQIFVVPLAVGIVIMAGALFAMVRLWRSRRPPGEGLPPPNG
ncbi:MAG TPA: hypothetical protein VM451_01185 [Candidatus Limnocylindria bacterium]|nr:hypothetical protein [Candidatus Limnocylindria bacterium]